MNRVWGENCPVVTLALIFHIVALLAMLLGII